MSDPSKADLERTVQRLRAAQELAMVGSWTMDLPSGTLSWSEQMFHILGLDPWNNLPSIESYQNLIHPEDQERIQAINDEAMQKGQGAEGVHRIVRPDGTERTVRAVSKVVSEEGAPTLLHGILQDVTVQVEGQRALEQVKSQDQTESQRFQALLDAAPDAIVITNPEGNITYTNKQVKLLFGYEPEELLGKKVEVLVPAKFRSTHPKNRDKFHAHPKTRSMGAGLDLMAAHKDGSEIPVEISLAPLEVKEGRLVMAAIRDITDRKTAEETERLAFEQNLKIGQLEEANQFRINLLNTVAHELNTPLTPLQLQAHILEQSSSNLDESQRKSLDILQRNIRRLTLLVSDILDMSRLENDNLALRPAAILVEDLVEDAMEAYQQTALEAEVALNSEVQPGIHLVADADRLTQVLYNLVGNAIKFTPAGGSVQLSAKQDGAFMEIAVTDSGMGITDREAKHLFTPFGQVHDDQTQPGTGLGLYISKNIVAQHGGSLTMDSSGRNLGTTFRVRLPLEPESQ